MSLGANNALLNSHGGNIHPKQQVLPESGKILIQNGRKHDTGFRSPLIPLDSVFAPTAEDGIFRIGKLQITHFAGTKLSEGTTRECG